MESEVPNKSWREAMYFMNHALPSKWWLDAINFLLGAALVWTAIAFSRGLLFPAANAVTVGTAIACISVIALYRYSTPWAERSNLALGLWAIIAPFLLGFGESGAPMLVHVLIGIGVATIATSQLLIGANGRAPAGARSSSR